MKQSIVKQCIFIIFVLAALVGVSACVAATAPQPTLARPAGEMSVEVSGGGMYTDVTAPRLAEMLQNKDFVFINTHIPYEGEIEATDDFIPFDQIAQSLDRWPADKSAKIVLYCRSGNMSTTASETLVGLGYTNVFNLAGGMKAWRAADLPIIEDANRK